MIGCDLSMPLCKSALPLFLNKEMLAISQDDLGVQVRLLRLLMFWVVTTTLSSVI